MGAYLCKDAEHAKQAKKEDNENAMLPASEKVKNQDNNEAADLENPDIPFADAVVDEEETNDKTKNNETGKVVNDYNRSSVENQEFHNENKNTDTLNAEITVDIIKNVESEPYHHTESKEEPVVKSDVHNESEFITPIEQHDEKMQPLIKEHKSETEVETHVESENFALNNFESNLQVATEKKSENVSLENNDGLNQECVNVLEYEKNQVHDLESKQIKEHNTEPELVQQQVIESEQTIEHDTESEQTKEHDTESEQTKEHYTESELTKEHDTESEQTKEHYTESEQTKEHDTESELTKEHDTESELTKEHYTESEQTKEHDTESEQTKEHDTESEQNKEHDTESEQNKEHDTESEQNKEHDTESEQNKEHDTESEQTKEHDTESEQTKEHDIESALTKEDEIETNQIEENSNKSEKIVTGSFVDLEEENVEGHNKQTESEISEVSNDFDTHKFIETESTDFPVETQNNEENEAIESNSEIKDDSISNADEIILEPESLESEKESSPEINDEINVEELEEHIKEHEEKYDEKDTLEEFTHVEDEKEAIEKQKNEVPEISEKESLVSIENENENAKISNEIDGEEEKHEEELSSDVAEKEHVEVHEVEDENIEEESNDQKVNITDEVLEENKSDLIIKDESQPSEELPEEITGSKSSAEHTEPIENSEITEEKVTANLNDNSLVDIDLSTQHISSNGNTTSEAHESDDQSISNEYEIENGVEDVKEEELIKMVSDAVDEIVGDAKSQVQHIVETPVSKDNSIDALEN